MLDGQDFIGERLEDRTSPALRDMAPAGSFPGLGGAPASPAPAKVMADLATLMATGAERQRNVEGPRRLARYRIEVDHSRDDLLPDCSRRTMDTRYMLAGESYQDVFARVAVTGSDDIEHARRLYHYFSNLWVMPATPVVSNLGAPVGLPISCFLNDVQDSIGGIVGKWVENIWLGVNGGGTGSYWGSVRSMAEKIGGGDEVGDDSDRGKTSGVLSFLKVQDSLCLCISQGGMRRAMNAAWMPVWHPEIEAFIRMRTVQGGDPNRKAINMHHGVCIPDEFMQAVDRDEPWNLISPKTGEVMQTVSARTLWIQILTARIEQGEPYILYVGAVNKMMPWYQANYGLEVKTSNLCAEIALPTGLDHYGNDRTAVCCLSSLNLDRWEEYHDNPQFFEDVYRFLDNVLSIFIADAPSSAAAAIYSAIRERSVGLGFMGWHDFLQKRDIAFESVAALAWDRRIDNHMRAMADLASYKLALERGPCPDAAEAGVMERFACKMAIAPTASISLIAGGVSPGNETRSANAFLQKTLAGSMIRRNPYLEKVLEQHGRNTPEVWSDITIQKGSVQHLAFLTDHQRRVYRTAFEIDHRWTVRQVALRTGICQMQSTNLFLPGDVHKRDLHGIHHLAWRLGAKSLYYCRSLSIQRADAPSQMVEKAEIDGVTNRVPTVDEPPKYETCEACQ